MRKSCSYVHEINVASRVTVSAGRWLFVANVALVRQVGHQTESLVSSISCPHITRCRRGFSRRGADILFGSSKATRIDRRAIGRS